MHGSGIAMHALCRKDVLGDNVDATCSIDLDWCIYLATVDTASSFSFTNMWCFSNVLCLATPYVVCKSYVTHVLFALVVL